MSEAAIILAIANLIFSGIVIYINLRQSKTLSQLRKEEKLFDINLTANIERFEKTRELVANSYEFLADLTVLATTTDEKKGKTNNSIEQLAINEETKPKFLSVGQKSDAVWLKLESLVASFNDKELTVRLNTYDKCADQLADEILKRIDSNESIGDHTSIISLLDTSWNCTQSLIERTYQLESSKKQQLLNPTRKPLLSRLRRTEIIE